MPHNPKALQAILQTAAPPDLELAFRPMFGGVMGYAEGRAFASMSDVGLALKMAGADHAALMALRGARPLQYGPDAPPSKSYVKLPEAMLEDREALRHWIVRSVAGLAPANSGKKLRVA
jgi:TfoX/Sxy family transcriptional regulator of competence genes